MKRRYLKNQHETAVLNSFVKYCANAGNEIKIKETPDPPDAIIDFNGSESWIEITDCFMDKKWAEDIFSYAAKDKVHIDSSNRIMINVDDAMLVNLVNVIANKYKKQSITNIYNEYGSGILLVGIYSPLNYATEFIDKKEEVLNGLSSVIDKRFSHILLYESSHEFYLLHST